MPSNDPAVYHVMWVGNKKSLVFAILVILFRVKCDDLPKNVVVMAGADKVLNCAEGGPFRWYRYLPSDPSNDKVLFMGSRMADNTDKRFRVLKEPENYPYQRLDLLITDVQANHSGTYKCKQPQNALCAELIVMGSEPNCKIYERKDTTKNMVELKCSINVTRNGQPEMLCEHQNKATLTDTSCSAGENGMFICLTKVPAEMKADYTCVIKIKHKPLFNNKMCNHASNEPDYQYTWQSSSGVCDDVLAVSSRFTVMELSCIIVLCASVIVNIILFVLCQCQKRQTKGYSSRKDSDTSSVATLTSDCESLTAERQDEMKHCLHVDSESSCIPPKIDV